MVIPLAIDAISAIYQPLYRPRLFTDVAVGVSEDELSAGATDMVRSTRTG